MASDRIGRFAKKRKAEPYDASEDEDEYEEQRKKQKIIDLNMSEIDFKNRLKEDESRIDGLEDFVMLAEAHRDGYDCTDIVFDYCSQSPECKEVFDLLDTKTKKPHARVMVSVFECLTQILQYVQADDNSKLWPTADFIVQKVASSHLEKVHFCLNPQNKSFKIKKVLKLLIALVVLNKKAKRVVQFKFRFDDNSLFRTLFGRRDRQDPEDVRSCIVLFTMSFIVDGDETLINTMLQQKSFLQMTLSGLVYDPKEMVMDVLSTLLDKLVLNEGVSRQAKLGVFTVNILMKICQLYEWEGPRGWKNDEKPFLTDVDFLEERSSVAGLVHKFLLAICSNKRYGLAFLDRSMGTGTRNFNPLMTRFLHMMLNKRLDMLKMKLCAKILDFCPDLFSHVMLGWVKYVSARGKDKRTNEIDFLIETYKIQTPIPAFLAKRDMMPEDVGSLVLMMMTYYLPCHGLWSCINEGIRNGTLPTSHQCLVLTNVILHNVTAVLSTVTSHKIPHIPSGTFSSALVSGFSSQAVRLLPTPAILFGCVDKILLILSDPKKLEEVGTEVDLVEHVSTVLKILRLYQGLCPTLLSYRPSDVAGLVEAVGRLQAIIDAAIEGVDDDTGPNVILPQLDLLELLSEMGVAILPLVQEGLLEKLLRSAHSLKEQHKKETISLVYKVLTSIGVLSDHKDELYLWIGGALASEAEVESCSPIEFLSSIVSSITSNPTSYLKRVTEAVSEGKELPVKGIQKGLKDPVIQDVLNMDDDDLDLTISTVLPKEPDHHATTILPFSPLTVAALEALRSGDKDACGEYVIVVMLNILHSQANPTPYSQLVSACWEGGPTGVMQYFDFWARRKTAQSPAVSSVSLKLATPYICHLLNWYMEGDSGNKLVTPDLEELEDIAEEKRLSYLKQALFYLSHCFSHKFSLGQKLKRVKILKKLITDIFTSFVNGLDESGMEVDDNEDEMSGEEDKSHEHGSHDDDEKVTEVVSNAILCIANSPVVNENFFTASDERSTPSSKTDDRSKMYQSVTRLMCDILMACKDLRLSPSCLEVLDTLLDRALNRLVVQGKDQADCLTIIKAISCHVVLPSINKCIYSFLKLPQASFVKENLTEGQVAKVHAGQMLNNLTPIGEIFASLLDLWVNTLKLYNVSSRNESSLTLTLALHPEHGVMNVENTPSHGTESSSENLADIQSHSKHNASHVTVTQLNTSDLSPLFDVLLLSSKLDSAVLSVVQHLSQVRACCSQDVFYSLVNNFSSLGKERRLMVEALVSSHSSFHQLCGQYIGKHAKAVLKKEGHFGLVRAYLQQDGVDSEIVETVCHRLLSSCQEILLGADDSLWACLHALIERPDIPDDFSQGLFEVVATFIPSNRSSTHSQHFSVLETICKHLYASCKGSESNCKDSKSHSKTEASFLELLLKFITHLSKRTKRNLAMEDELIQLAKTSLKRGGVLSQDFVATSWAGFVKSVLKHMYNRHASLDLVAALMSKVFGGKGAVTDCGDADPSMTFQMCVSHTAFMPTLMSTTDTLARDSLIHFLHKLFTLRPSCVTTKLLTPLVGAYTATLSLTDQRLLAMINACLLADETENNQLPVLWGKAYLDHKATYTSFGQGGRPANVSMDMVLGEIDAQKMEETILNFATKRNTKEFKVFPADELMSKPNCYDPNYLLRVFVQILAPNKIVQVRAFSEKDCVGFLLACLSSKNHHCRLVAYKCLNDFYAHLEKTPSPARHEFAYILDVLNASRTENGQRLPFVITLYFGRAIKLVLDPSDHMYLRIMKFLCHKPEINLNTLPEFYKFFFSAETQFLTERTWMLTLLRDGIRDGPDYQMYRRSFVYKHLMSFYTSLISDKLSKVMVLECIRNACRQVHAVKDLIKDYGLILWLSHVINGLEKRSGSVEVVADILDTVCGSLGIRDRVEVIDYPGVRSQSGEEEHVESGNIVPKQTSQSTVVSLQMLVKAFNLMVSQRRSEQVLSASS